MLIDTHCHLDFPFFLEPVNEQAQVIERALAAGVTQLINVGCDWQSSCAGVQLARLHEFIFCTLGVHPNESVHWNEEVLNKFFDQIQLDRQGETRKIVAIGEIGLDYFRLGAPVEVQKQAFVEQLRLAKSAELPVVIHCRDAFDDALTLLEQEKMERVAFHCYSGDLDIAKRIWERGWITSFAAVVSYPKNQELRKVVQECPSTLYFLETDAPFLPHQSLRGKRNEPSYLPRLAETVAEWRSMSFDQVAHQSTRNAQDFFRLQASKNGS